MLKVSPFYLVFAGRPTDKDIKPVKYDEAPTENKSEKLIAEKYQTVIRSTWIK
jgi:hypothetical protein